MYGAILGDIAGSRIEFSRPRGFNYKKEPIFVRTCRFTDDSVLTIATKYAILNDMNYARAYKLFARRYRKAGYGEMFINWLESNSVSGYGSYGNGAAMRVSFIGEKFDTLDMVHEQAVKSAMCTHDHNSGLNAAKATAGMIFLAKNGYSKKEITSYLRKNYNYKVDIPLRLYRPFSKFDPTADGTMPIVIRCFLESDNYESCIRNAFSIKCDTDTVACIAGSIAEAFYGTTGFDDLTILKRYLVKPDSYGNFDNFLYKWATADEKSNN